MNEDSINVRQSFVNRDVVWCLTISEDCLPVVQEEAMRENGQELPENSFNILYISVSICIAVVTLVYSCAAAMCCPRETVDPAEPEVDRLRRENAELRRGSHSTTTRTVVMPSIRRETSAPQSGLSPRSSPQIRSLLKEKDKEIVRLQRALASAQRV